MGGCDWLRVLDFRLVPLPFSIVSEYWKGGILDFETAFQEKSADLSTELTYFANGYKDLKTEDERFTYAEDFEKETGFAFFLLMVTPSIYGRVTE